MVQPALFRLTPRKDLLTPMPTPTSPAPDPRIKHNPGNVFQLSCACRRVLVVHRGRATCTLCQRAYAVRVESWSIRTEDPAPVAEEPTVSGREGLR